MYKVIYKVNPRDNIGTALGDLKRGDTCPIFEEERGIIDELVLRTSVPQWYKVALEYIPEDSRVLKFGLPIGTSTMDIEPGVVVHVTNVILSQALDFEDIVEGGFVLGEASAYITKGDIIRVGKNLKPTHTLIRDLPRGTRIGFAASHVPEGSPVRVGNMVDLKRRLGWNEKYRRLVKDFYRFLWTGLINMSR